MNPLRRAVHLLMNSTGLDRRVDADEINAWRERRLARPYPVLPAKAANEWIGQILKAGKPAAIGKLGSSECWTLAWHRRLKRFYKYTWTSPAFGDLDLAEQSGVFPNTEAIFHRFSELYLERLRLFDGLAVWYNVGESELLNSYCPGVQRLDLQCLDPFFFDPPWSAALAGQRVLVVHPFEESIRRQFARRDQIWPEHPAVLPECELEIVKAPYGFSKTGFTDWLEMNRWLEQQVEACYRQKPFDVALIGCGAAGVPLAGFVKKLGAIGIHMGGATQLLFGIRGGRWDRRSEYQQFFNEAWVRALPAETPQEAKRVDQGGYW